MNMFYPFYNVIKFRGGGGGGQEVKYGGSGSPEFLENLQDPSHPLPVHAPG